MVFQFSSTLAESPLMREPIVTILTYRLLAGVIRTRTRAVSMSSIRFLLASIAPKTRGLNKRFQTEKEGCEFLTPTELTKFLIAKKTGEDNRRTTMGMLRYF